MRLASQTAIVDETDERHEPDGELQLELLRSNSSLGALLVGLDDGGDDRDGVGAQTGARLGEVLRSDGEAEAVVGAGLLDEGGIRLHLLREGAERGAVGRLGGGGLGDAGRDA